MCISPAQFIDMNDTSNHVVVVKSRDVALRNIFTLLPESCLKYVTNLENAEGQFLMHDIFYNEMSPA